MKRIALLGCGLVLLVANTAEARRQRWSNNRTYYTQPVAAAPITYTAQPTNAEAPDSAAAADSAPEAASDAAAAATPAAAATTSAPATTAAQNVSATTVTTVSYSTASAQGVANLMAAYNRVGHWGGNPGYEGCGCGATPAAAYNTCCFANSGMATVDVGYAQGASGMWFCCRRYR